MPSLDHDARVTGAQAAKLFGITRQAITMWKRRGHLVPGDDGLYRLGDVLRCNGRMRRKPQSHRTLVTA